MHRTRATIYEQFFTTKSSPPGRQNRGTEDSGWSVTYGITKSTPAKDASRATPAKDPQEQHSPRFSLRRKAVRLELAVSSRPEWQPVLFRIGALIDG